jgi:hypothetical protein
MRSHCAVATEWEHVTLNETQFLRSADLQGALASRVTWKELPGHCPVAAFRLLGRLGAIYP